MEVLTHKQFEVLTALERGENVSTLNAAVETEVETHGWVTDGRLTESGRAALEPYRVKRAILLAAGLGSRMRPVTNNLPKPMVTVHETPLIETLIQALEAKGIDDIIVVTGYLHECFEPLKQRHPKIQFIHNDRYLTENNISSARLVKHLYANAYVMDADLYLRNPDLIRRYEYETNYLGVWVDKTDDWCLKMDGERATQMVRGGTHCPLMIGLSYWTADAAARFAKDLETLYASAHGKQCFWDDVALTYLNSHYDIHVRACQASDIVEIDSVRELATLDTTYLSILKELK